mmetsp:Transcript_172358/g.552459  ORF Transcript_172358/g.552459 Transcript_172358/m.552459 type:complete len:279 (+) Transcript_172358:299-1135(+)
MVCCTGGAFLSESFIAASIRCAASVAALMMLSSSMLPQKLHMKACHTMSVRLISLSRRARLIQWMIKAANTHAKLAYIHESVCITVHPTKVPNIHRETNPSKTFPGHGDTFMATNTAGAQQQKQNPSNPMIARKHSRMLPTSQNTVLIEGLPAMSCTSSRHSAALSPAAARPSHAACLVSLPLPVPLLPPAATLTSFPRCGLANSPRSPKLLRAEALKRKSLCFMVASTAGRYGTAAAPEPQMAAQAICLVLLSSDSLQSASARSAKWGLEILACDSR